MLLLSLNSYTLGNVIDVICEAHNTHSLGNSYNDGYYAIRFQTDNYHCDDDDDDYASGLMSEILGKVSISLRAISRFLAQNSCNLILYQWDGCSSSVIVIVWCCWLIFIIRDDNIYCHGQFSAWNLTQHDCSIGDNI